jgi:predicted MFS family arabinose efflux permease
VSSYLLPYGFFQLLYGPIADRLGKIRVAAGTMVIFSLLTALSGAFSEFGTLIVLRALTGASAAAVIPLSIAYIGDTVPYAHRQVALSRMMATPGAAHAGAPSSEAPSVMVLSWRSVFLPLRMLAGVVAVLLVIHREDGPSVGPGARDRRYAVALRAPQLLPLLLLVAFEGSLFMGVLPYLSGLIAGRFALGSLAIGLLLSLSGATQLLAAWLMPHLLRCFSEAAMLAIGGTFMGLAYLIIAVAGSWPVVALGSGLVGLGFSVGHSTLQTRATEILPAGRATSLSLFAFALFSGSSFGSVAFSWSSGRIGHGLSFGCCGVLFFVFTAMAWALLGRRPLEAARASCG